MQLYIYIYYIYLPNGKSTTTGESIVPFWQKALTVASSPSSDMNFFSVQ